MFLSKRKQKTMKLNPCKIAVMMGLLLSLPGSALYGFTYQGRLHDGGDPAQSRYDMYFTLYDAAVKGNAVSDTIKLYDVQMTNGYFTVELDFGSSGYAFNGQPRWLETALKPAGLKVTPETLSPRQKIAPVPYAKVAEAAERLQVPAFITNSIVRMDVEGLTKGWFHYFDQMGASVEIVTYQDGEDPILRKRPGRTTISTLELKCFANGDSYLEDWYDGVKAARVERRTLVFTMLDQDGKPIDRWQMSHCWPCMIRYDYDPRFESVVMTVGLAVEELQRLDVSPTEDPHPWQPGPQPMVKRPFRLDFENDQYLSFSAFRSLGAQTEIVEYEDGEDRILRKRPGRTTFFDPVFVRGVHQDTFLQSWYQHVLDGMVVRYSPVFSMNNSAGEPLIQSTLMHCWPCRVRSVYDHASKTMNEEITLACEELTN